MKYLLLILSILFSVFLILLFGTIHGTFTVSTFDDTMIAVQALKTFSSIYFLCAAILLLKGFIADMKSSRGAKMLLFISVAMFLLSRTVDAELEISEVAWVWYASTFPMVIYSIYAIIGDILIQRAEARELEEDSTVEEFHC